MAEPRRSGRATKGQHTKIYDLEQAPAAPKRGKKGKRSSKANDDDESGEEDDSIIRCICGATEDKDGWMMISCETCTAWQHNLCMGITEEDDKLPDKYYCEQCRPGDHKDLLAAMSRGEEPWRERILERRESKKPKKKGKKGSTGGRKSARPSNAPTSEAASSPKAPPSQKSPTPAAEAGTKRKYEAVVEITNGHQKQSSSTPAKSPAAPSPSAQPEKSTEPLAKRAKSISEAPRIKSPTPATPTITSIDQLPKERFPVAKALRKELEELIPNAMKKSQYIIPSGQTVESLAIRMTLDIEDALHKRHADNYKQYGDQFRAIKFNLKKNHSLFKQIIDGSLLPSELADMSSEDMLSDELQQERLRLKEEADKQAILAQDTGPRYRKTHKGDELIGDEPTHEPSETYASNTESLYHAPSRQNTMEQKATNVHIDTGSPPPSAELPEDYDRPQQSAVTPTSATKPNFNLQHVLSNVKPIDPAKAGMISRPPKRQSISRAPEVTMRDAADDPDLDKILKNEDNDAPANTGDSSIVWRGGIEMSAISSFTAVARWVAGGDIGQKIPYKDMLKSNVEIDGRIDIKRADDYVSGMRFSQSTDVCCLALFPASDRDDDGLKRIYQYFKEKNRWGVFATHGHEAVRDVYIVIVEEGGPEKLPHFIQMLEAKSIPPVRQTPMLLLTLVVRTKGASSNMSTPQATPLPQTLAGAANPMHAGIPPHTPVNQSHPSFSPVAQMTPQFAPPLSHSPTPPAVLSALAVQILGPYIREPVVTQIMQSVTDMTDVQLQNLRDILEKEPATRSDLTKLAAHLQQRQAGTA
ncbi:hypothetical protein BT63DRAFT_439362 [Microthyrium microscopicum]|uniref:Transcription factor BYE1 n=1 Tax=Microthyrium microscopicum TaxID=703497 RepID=A0A6A6UFR4_9PEZI|nr:hypothetical protein BT63DRAFT_439362 [Microthyrium microscopicum]